jgi:hypothetical protein
MQSPKMNNILKTKKIKSNKMLAQMNKMLAQINKMLAQINKMLARAIIFG